MRLEEIANIKACNVNKKFILLDTDIVMCIAGANIGDVSSDEQKQKHSASVAYCIISPFENIDIKNIINKHKDEIKKLARGNAIHRVHTKDLLNLELD